MTQYFFYFSNGEIKAIGFHTDASARRHAMLISHNNPVERVVRYLDDQEINVYPR